MESKAVKFAPEVTRAVFDKERRTDGCIENILSTTLVKEHELANRCTESQNIDRFKRKSFTSIISKERVVGF